jgi:hypothetical protein
LSCEGVNRNEIAANCNTRHRVIFLLDLPLAAWMPQRGRIFQLTPSNILPLRANGWKASDVDRIERGKLDGRRALFLVADGG